MPIRRYRPGGHPYHSYRHRSPLKKTSSKKISWRIIFSFIFIVFLAFTTWQLTAPLPPLKITAIQQTKTRLNPTDFTWPVTVDTAIGIDGKGVVAHKNSREIAGPTASTAKLITVLAVLQKKPLKLTESGPVIAMTDQDVDIFNTYYNQDGSTSAVKNGLQLSQYQMLQAILISSSNNYADSLAVWAFGSLANYRTYAQQYVASIGATQTKIGDDASGFSPTTTSTTADLVKIGLRASRHPVIREIMKQPSVELPLTGVKQNTNWLLGETGVIGGKTGNITEAKGVFVAIAQHMVERQPVTVVTATRSDVSVADAIKQSQAVLEKSYPFMTKDRIISANTPLLMARSDWGQKSTGYVAQDLNDIIWNRTVKTPIIKTSLRQETIKNGVVMGAVKYGKKTYPIISRGSIEEPSIWWKLTHFNR